MDGLPPSLDAAGLGLVERLLARVGPDDRVAALFLGGSHAAGTADEHSDLDLYLITTDAGFKSFREDRLDLMRSLGRPVFLEEHSNFGFLMLLFMYPRGVHGEIALAPAGELAEVHGGPHLVLLDKAGLLAGRVFPEERLEPAGRRDLLRRLLVWFWYERRLLRVAIARGNLWTAQFYLWQCRERCLDLARLRALPDRWPDGHEKVERVLDPQTLARFDLTAAPLDREAIEHAADVLTDLYLDLGPDLARIHGVAYPEDLVRSMTEPPAHSRG